MRLDIQVIVDWARFVFNANSSGASRSFLRSSEPSYSVYSIPCGTATSTPSFASLMC